MHSINYHEEFVRCALDPWYCATHYYYTLARLDDGSFEKRLIPDWPFAKELFYAFLSDRNVIVAKSRQMLASWLAMAAALYKLQFDFYYVAKVISRKQDLVSDGGGLNKTPDSLLGKMLFIWNNMAPWLRPPLEWGYLKVTNPVTGGVVIGESTDQRATRGGTYRHIFADEWAHVKNSEILFSAMNAACPSGKKLISTPNGRGNNFARIWFSKDTNFQKIRLHWRLHPERDEAWYERETKDLGPSERAREYEISFELSISGRVYPDFDPGKQVRRLEVIKDIPIHTAWDFGVGDPTSIIFIQEVPDPYYPKYPRIHIINELEASGHTPDFYARAVFQKYPPTMYGEHYGDPAGKARSLNLKSWITWLRELGIHIKYRTGYTLPDRILATSRIIPRLVVDDRCVLFQERILNYRYPTDPEGRVLDNKPIHDWTSHMMSALEFYAIYKFPIRKKEVRAL